MKMRIALCLGVFYLMFLGVSAQEGAGKKEAIARLAAKLEGTWAISITLPGNEKQPGRDGKGQEIFERGPGEGSFVERYHSTGTEGEIRGLGIFWWNEAGKAYRVLWCDNEESNGCKPMSGGGKWENGDLVLRHQFVEKGKKMELKEVFGDFTANSYAQRIYLRPQDGEWKLATTIRATKVTK